MTNKKQVIINGCNVSKCVHLDRYFLPNNNKEFKDCALSNLYYREFEHSCKDNPSCYFKQLARKIQELEVICKAFDIEYAYDDDGKIFGRSNKLRSLEQECEELKEKLRELEFKNTTLQNRNQQLDSSITKADRYRKALEEIEEIAKSFNKNELCFYKEINECDCCDMGADCNYLRRAKILYIINKAKGEEDD